MLMPRYLRQENSKKNYKEIMQKNIYLPKENKAQIEEVREIENKEQEQKKDESKASKVVEKLEEKIVPKVYASDLDLNEADKSRKRNVEEAIGGGLTVATAANPLAGGVVAGAT